MYDINLAKICLKEFHKNAGVLYDLQQYTYNVHQLLFFQCFVKSWDPIWARYTFMFENLSDLLGKSVTGNTQLGQEIATTNKRQIMNMNT